MGNKVRRKMFGVYFSQGLDFVKVSLLEIAEARRKQYDIKRYEVRSGQQIKES